MTVKALTRLEVPVTADKFQQLKRSGGEITVPWDLIDAPFPEVMDWDRVKFTNGENFKEYEFEGITVQGGEITLFIGDQRTKS